MIDHATRQSELILAIHRAKTAVQCGCPLADMYVKEAHALGARTIRELAETTKRPATTDAKVSDV